VSWILGLCSHHRIWSPPVVSITSPTPFLSYRVPVAVSAFVGRGRITLAEVLRFPPFLRTASPLPFLHTSLPSAGCSGVSITTMSITSSSPFRFYGCNLFTLSGVRREVARDVAGRGPYCYDRPCLLFAPLLSPFFLPRDPFCLPLFVHDLLWASCRCMLLDCSSVYIIQHIAHTQHYSPILSTHRALVTGAPRGATGCTYKISGDTRWSTVSHHANNTTTLLKSDTESSSCCPSSTNTYIYNNDLELCLDRRGSPRRRRGGCDVSISYVFPVLVSRVSYSASSVPYSYPDSFASRSTFDPRSASRLRIGAAVYRHSPTCISTAVVHCTASRIHTRTRIRSPLYPWLSLSHRCISSHHACLLRPSQDYAECVGSVGGAGGVAIGGEVDWSRSRSRRSRSCPDLSMIWRRRCGCGRPSHGRGSCFAFLFTYVKNSMILVCRVRTVAPRVW